MDLFVTLFRSPQRGAGLFSGGSFAFGLFLHPFLFFTVAHDKPPESRISACGVFLDRKPSLLARLFGGTFFILYVIQSGWTVTLQLQLPSILGERA